MRKRWKYVLVIAGIGLAVVSALLATREREPEYQGKKMSPPSQFESNLRGVADGQR